MGKSRRKFPGTGFTLAESDKEFKKESHRRLRAHERRLMRQVQYDEDFPLEIELTNPYASPKDGKQMFDPKKDPKLMRK